MRLLTEESMKAASTDLLAQMGELVNTVRATLQDNLDAMAIEVKATAETNLDQLRYVRTQLNYLQRSQFKPN